MPSSLTASSKSEKASRVLVRMRALMVLMAQHWSYLRLLFLPSTKLARLHKNLKLMGTVHDRNWLRDREDAVRDLPRNELESRLMMAFRVSTKSLNGLARLLVQILHGWSFRVTQCCLWFMT
jgi:hypothetical protein